MLYAPVANDLTMTAGFEICLQDEPSTESILPAEHLRVGPFTPIIRSVLGATGTTPSSASVSSHSVAVQAFLAESMTLVLVLTPLLVMNQLHWFISPSLRAL